MGALSSKISSMDLDDVLSYKTVKVRAMYQWSSPLLPDGGNPGPPSGHLALRSSDWHHYLHFGIHYRHQ
jgi:hypothetical protein